VLTIVLFLIFYLFFNFSTFFALIRPFIEFRDGAEERSDLVKFEKNGDTQNFEYNYLVTFFT
jgi:hypothetical protein